MSPRRPFQIIAAAARKVGLCISYYPPPFSHARQLKQYLAQARINCVLDVGAYVGDFAAGLRSNGYGGQIVSLEPDPQTFTILRKKMNHDPQWTGMNYGLSDVTATLEMNRYGDASLNSLLPLQSDAAEAYGVDLDKAGKVTAQFHRLDEVLPGLVANIDDPRIFLKMDTQGHDLNVIRGAEKVLPFIVGFQSEMPAIRLYKEMPTMSQALDAYAALGYTPIGFHVVNAFEDTMATPEFDVIFNRFDGRLTERLPTVKK